MRVRQLSEFLRRDEASGARRRRRALAAFILGAAISAAGLATLASFPSLAHGPFTAGGPAVYTLSDPGPAQPVYSPVIVERKAARGDDETPRRERIRVIAGGYSARPTARGGYAGSQPVCVRLCDGFFFPLSSAAGDVASQDAACNSLCPDAPTEVYYRNGAEKIEGAVSAHGRLYSALPVSLRYSRTSDNTCACHRDVVAYAPLRDATLKLGDAVMTPAGFMVFRGHEAASHGPGDFTALVGAALSAPTRGALQAMERASLTPTHPSLKNWLVTQAPFAPQVAARAPMRSASADNKIRLLVWSGAQN